MKKLLAILILLLLRLLPVPAPVEASTNGSVPQEAWTEAGRGLEMFRAKVAEDPVKWGFESAEDAERLTLGEGFRIAYIGKSAITAEDETSLLETEDTTLYPTWLFIVDHNGAPASFIQVYRPPDAACTLAGFGGDARYLAIALDAFRKTAGDAATPTLMQRNAQYFLVLQVDGRESVLPVPYDLESRTIVEAGQGLVSPSVVIRSIRAQAGMDTGEKTRGNAYLDPWRNTINAPSGHVPLLVFLVCMGAIAITVIISRLLGQRARKKRMQRRWEATLGQPHGSTPSSRPRRRTARKRSDIERGMGQGPFQEAMKQENGG